MKLFIKAFSFLTVFVLVFGLVFVPSRAVGNEAENLTRNVTLTFDGFSNTAKLTDRNEGSYSVGVANATLNIKSEQVISGIYLIFDREYGEYTVSSISSAKKSTVNEIFIHQFIDIEDTLGTTTELELTFPTDGVRITEFYVFGKGSLPNWVQRWQMPCEKADLLIVSTHADDEHLFFAGTIPYFAANGYAVQIAYVTDHYDSSTRQHERLNGLWTAGVKNYPVFGRFRDAWADNLAAATSNLKSSGASREELVIFLTETIRRFKPLVIMGQDFDGEYGHGQHMLSSDALAQAVEEAADSTLYTDIKYDAYDTPKTYFHLYGENKIHLEYDTPLEVLGGKTAFEVSQQAFKCHKSQLYTWFTKWLCGTESAPITKASEITKYSPLEFGLYRTTVGFDSGKGDLFESVTPYFLQKEDEPKEEKQDEVTDDSISKEETKKEKGSMPVILIVILSVLGFLLASIIFLYFYIYVR